MKEARRDALAKLFASKYGGDRARFMKAAGLTKGRITQLFDESEPFGEVAARRLAERLGLRPDYFERPDAAAGSALPPPPGPKFTDRHEVTPSDWALLQSVKVVLNDQQQAEITRQAQELAQRYKAILPPLAAPSVHEPAAPPYPPRRSPGDSNFGGLDDLKPRGVVVVKPPRKAKP